jgi:hypothetical protein
MMKICGPGAEPISKNVVSAHASSAACSVGGVWWDAPPKIPKSVLPVAIDRLPSGFKPIVLEGYVLNHSRPFHWMELEGKSIWSSAQSLDPSSSWAVSESVNVLALG